MDLHDVRHASGVECEWDCCEASLIIARRKRIASELRRKLLAEFRALCHSTPNPTRLIAPIPNRAMRESFCVAEIETSIPLIFHEFRFHS